ncbi:NADP-dependent alcohol dehydrogenase [Blastomyces dermatitidis ATCC 18188]|uniref:NADP-dependent alcohol dehydrogenase n=1 Tax=Ajellomyces dermatitidis (strain ATCC 18188 / CBS 674.68) TaxID=653446 RepID=F2T8E3_AJEDA|nr:NADP-dependent alcohol dehydrogenase [Blastomyces dermatitidis ATCC 18188]
MSFTFDVIKGAKDGRLVAAKTTRSLQPNQVYIEITHSGVCGTDEHYRHVDQVLGHEGIGIVREAGSGVTNVDVGDRVGIGYFHEVCGLCPSCLAGWDQYCENKKEYGSANLDIGSFANGAVWNADLVFRIPDGIDSVDAAPLMCAGGTVWTILAEYGVRPGDRVGILGVGGLGHLAISGHCEYHVFRSGQTLESMKPLKHLLLCGSAGVDFNSLIPLMDKQGSIYPITVDMNPSSIPLFPVLHNGIRIQGSLVSSRRNMHKLLQLCAAKGIKPTTMQFPLTVAGAEEAMKNLREGKIRYRAVLAREGV